MGKELANLTSSKSNTRQSTSSIALEWVRSNLIATIGYELWNPLSTIQVCIESLAREPEMLEASKQVILETALNDVRVLHRSIEKCMEFSQAEFARFDTSDSAALESTSSAQQILRETVVRILESQAVRADSDPVADLLDNIVGQDQILSEPQEEILEHIRSNLIAIVGHEIRTPLCTIEVCLESLNHRTPIPWKYRHKMLDIALKDLARLQKLIGDFFILDRLEKGQVYYREDYIRVSEAVALALDSLKDRPRLPQIILEIPPQLPLVKVDEDILIKALIELLDNACKFSNYSGKVTIQARVVEAQILPSRSNKQQNLMLEIIIADNGRGIIPNHLEAVFNCFYQEENSLRRTVNGTGIGLTICRRIINSLGGKIWANSLGKDCGSSIHFTLPVAV